MAKKTKEKVTQVHEQTLADGTMMVWYSDGTVRLFPAPIEITSEEAQAIIKPLDEDDDDEDEEDEEEKPAKTKGVKKSEPEPEDEEDEDDEEDDEEDDDDEDDSDEELDWDTLKGMDFSEMEKYCLDNDLDTDPDDYEEDEEDGFRKAMAKELGIEIPKKSKKK